MVLDQKPMVYVGILVHADRYDRKVWHLLVERQQARQLLDAWSAEGRPKVENHDASAQLAQIDGLRSIAQNKLRCRLVDVPWVTAPVAPGCEQHHHQRQTYPCFAQESTHNTLQFL